MNKVINFVHLDYMTVKPYFTVKNIMIFAFVALFMATMSGSIASGINIGVMIATIFVSYPFAVGEKSNLDALYASLSIKRRSVVQGRYVFIVLLNLCTILFSSMLATAGLFIGRATGLLPDGTDSGNMELVLIMAGLFLVTQTIQLPIFFKLGYAKAKVLSILPFAALMACYMALVTMSITRTFILDTGKVLSDHRLVVPFLIIVLACIVALSYGLSVKFYKRREF